jgi:hypothetical protein
MVVPTCVFPSVPLTGPGVGVRDGVAVGADGGVEVGVADGVDVGDGVDVREGVDVGAGAVLSTVICTEAAVLELPAASRARAVNAYWPFPTVRESQATVYKGPPAVVCPTTFGPTGDLTREKWHPARGS